MSLDQFRSPESVSEEAKLFDFVYKALHATLKETLNCEDTDLIYLAAELSQHYIVALNGLPDICLRYALSDYTYPAKDVLAALQVAIVTVAEDLPGQSVQARLGANGSIELITSNPALLI